MKNTKDRIINKYIKNVVKLLPLSCREKIKKDLYTSISNAFEEDSVVSKELLSQQFGTPDSFAAEYLSAMDIAQLQTHLLRSQKQKRRMATALICLVLLLIPISIWIGSESQRHRSYHYTVGLEVHSIP